MLALDAALTRSFEELTNASDDGAHRAAFIAPRPSIKERLAAGKSLRDRVPRASHATYAPATDRADPIDILERQNASRVQKRVPLRYGRMLASPFAFLRGSAAVMAADLAATPATGIGVYACGDMHVANFGVFASAERRLIFAINDFDEVFPGAWEWDLKRLAASAAVAARFMGGDRAAGEEAVRELVRSYRKRMKRYAEMGWLEVWYDTIDERAVLDALSPRVRQLADMKGGTSFNEDDENGLESLPEYCALCGWALALAHAKSGDPAMIAGYCGNSDELDGSIACFATAYQKQTDRDHEALAAARRAGRIEATTE